MIGKLFKKDKKQRKKYASISISTSKVNVPTDLYVRCKSCNSLIYKRDIEFGDKKCDNCSYLFRLAPRERIEQLADKGTFSELFSNYKSLNPLDFKGYEEKIKKQSKQSNENEAVLTGSCTILDKHVAIAVMNPYFMMGSMGSVVGEKITALIEYSTENKMPVIIFTASGGARMQEGIFSLMQMAKTSAALKRHSEEGNLYISVLTDPTTGGVSASFAMLGDIILAEPKALIGFAGPRVIQQTIRQELPEGFQRSEFLLEHGFIDKIVDRSDMREMIGRILSYH